MSYTEKEWKYIFHSPQKYMDVIKKIHEESLYKKTGILQWFINPKIDQSGYERIRLEISKEKDSYRHVWTYCKKEETENKETGESQYANKMLETEYTLDMNNINDEKPDFLSKEMHQTIIKVKNNLSELKQYPAVFKIRYFLMEKDYEFVLDELIPIGQYRYPNVSHIIEIEQKTEKSYNLQTILEQSRVLFKEDDLLKKEDQTKEEYNLLKNKNIAIHAYEAAKNIENAIPVPQKAISFIENRLVGPVAVIALQGNSLKFYKRTFMEYSEQTHREETDDYEDLIKGQLKYKNEHNQDTAVASIAELDSLYLLRQAGYAVQKAYYFVFPDDENNQPSRFRDEQNQRPDIYKDLESYTQRFLKIKCEPIPIKYSSKSREMINKTYAEIQKGINAVQEKEKSNNRELLFDIASGQKYPGIMAVMYCMFSQKPFFYKQERSMELIKFPAVPVNWDSTKIDGYYAFFHMLENQNISYRRYISLPQSIKNIFDFTQLGTENQSSDLVSLLQLEDIKKAYETTKKIPLGYGEDFLNYIENEKWRNYVSDQIRDVWSLQWIGDQIPETVEHSQRHSKRLMEFAHNLINIIGKDTFLKGIPEKLHDHFFFILAIAMNVHDLGHTNTIWHFENDRKMFLDGLPGVVRDLHNELTVQMLEEKTRGKEFQLLKGMEDLINEQELEKMKTAIKLVCKYHRGYLKIKNKGGKDKRFAKIFRLDLTSLEQVLKKAFNHDPDWIPLTQIAAQWLRFIDGTDVQADRAQSKDYSRIRTERTAMESYNIALELMNQYNNYIRSLNLEFDLQKTMKILKAFRKDPGNEDWAEELEKKGSYLENAVYDVIEEIVKCGTNEEYFKIPYELKQLARFAFKIRQFPHFNKHASVLMGYPRFYREKYDENEQKQGKLFIQYIIEKENEKIEKTLRKDVKDEFETALINEISQNGLKSIEIEIEVKEKKVKNKDTL